jgi:lysozyme family protein
MADLTPLKAANAKRWADAKIIRNFSAVARALVDAKARYQAVETRTGVPWFVIAVIHERECSQNWKGSLAQGDPWDKVSVHVPAGRGPFPSWQACAVDALVNCAPFAARNKDWSAGGILTLLESYNGLGYFHKGLPSPYIWSGTDQYKSGKYVRDGVFDASAIDVQLGCAGLLRAMMALDPTITFTGLVLTPISSGDTKPKPADLHEKDNEPNLGPAPAAPGFGYALAKLFAFIASLFKRKTP